MDKYIKRVGRRLTITRGSTLIQISKLAVDNYNMAPQDQDVVIEDVIDINGELYYKYVDRSDNGEHTDFNELISNNEYWFTKDEWGKMQNK